MLFAVIIIYFCYFGAFAVAVQYLANPYITFQRGRFLFLYSLTILMYSSMVGYIQGAYTSNQISDLYYLATTLLMVSVTGLWQGFLCAGRAIDGHSDKLYAYTGLIPFYNLYLFYFRPSEDDAFDNSTNSPLALVTHGYGAGTIGTLLALCAPLFYGTAFDLAYVAP